MSYTPTKPAVVHAVARETTPAGFQCDGGLSAELVANGHVLQIVGPDMLHRDVDTATATRHLQAMSAVDVASGQRVRITAADDDPNTSRVYELSIRDETGAVLGGPDPRS